MQPLLGAARLLAAFDAVPEGPLAADAGLQNVDVLFWESHTRTGCNWAPQTDLKTALGALEVHAAAPGEREARLAVGAAHAVLLEEGGQLQLLRVGIVQLQPLGVLLAADVLVGLRPLYCAEIV